MRLRTHVAAENNTVRPLACAPNCCQVGERDPSAGSGTSQTRLMPAFVTISTMRLIASRITICGFGPLLAKRRSFVRPVDRRLRDTLAGADGSLRRHLG